jgi:hypothetical protein
LSIKRVRVLYVGNTAGAMTSTADWLSNNGHEARIIMESRYDPWGLTFKSPNARMVDESEIFHKVIHDEIKKFKPTHIHINSSVNGAAVARAASPYVPIVFHYHGGDVRGRLYTHRSVRLNCDKLIVSTPDLKMYGEWWSCPIQSKFTYRGGRKPGTAISLLPPSLHFDFEHQCKKYAKIKGLDLTLIDTRKGERVAHDDLPELLSKYEYYLDFKGVRVPGALSMAAKEAYAVGCKVIHDSDLSKVVDDYIERTPEDYLNLYLSIKQPSMAITALRLGYSLPRSMIMR